MVPGMAHARVDDEAQRILPGGNRPFSVPDREISIPSSRRSSKARIPISVKEHSAVTGMPLMALSATANNAALRLRSAGAASDRHRLNHDLRLHGVWLTARTATPFDERLVGSADALRIVRAAVDLTQNSATIERLGAGLDESL